MMKHESIANIIDAIVRERDKARAEGNYELADKLRDSMNKFAVDGWELKLQDTPTGTQWHWSAKCR